MFILYQLSEFGRSRALFYDLNILKVWCENNVLAVFVSQESPVIFAIT